MKKHTQSGGFTLIEILAAMAVLVVIVLLFVQIYNEAIDAWTWGAEQTEVHDLGRSVGELIQKDLQTCVVDDLLPFAMYDEYNDDADALFFVASTWQRRKSSLNQDIVPVSYFVVRDATSERGKLLRKSSSSRDYDTNINPIQEMAPGRSLDSYGGIKDYLDRLRAKFATGNSNVELLVDNIYDFNVRVFSQDGGERLNFYSKAPTFGGKKPGRVIVEFSLLPERLWAQEGSPGWKTRADQQAYHFQFTMTVPVTRISE